MSEHFDVAIIGSGFSGSILARILALRGRKVALLDSAVHPRFAIGESSTPIADLLLDRLGRHYGLDDLAELSSYGRWQQTHPQLACGMKRGFSYFDQRGGSYEAAIGERSMIVAASPTDSRSDTHWYRQDVDAHLFQKAIASGVDAKERFAVAVLELSATDAARLSSSAGQRLSADFVIDASGAAAVSAHLLGLPTQTNQLLTKTCAAFAHFRGVGSYSQAFNSLHGDERAFDPFNSDNAAQHHLVDEGWVWMLRMNNGITSVGITSPLMPDDSKQHVRLQRAVAALESRLIGYPLLNETLRESVIVAPGSGIATIGRVQRRYDPVVAKNCLMLPTTAATLDPLHSTGIAHALSGVWRVAEIVLGKPDASQIANYRSAVLSEIQQIDQLVAMAYAAMGSFQRFSAACMVYFAAAIACEERLGRGEIPNQLWMADDDQFIDAVSDCVRIINSDATDAQVTATLRDRIAPWNHSGLFSSHNKRYAYTATK